MRGLPSITWWRFLGWLALGLFIYALYGVRHSRLRRGQIPALAPAVRVLAPLTLVAAAAAWWFLPHPASLLTPIALLFACALFAFWSNSRAAAPAGGGPGGISS
jgi:hypothetical protein